MNEEITLYKIVKGKGATGAPNKTISETSRTVFAEVDTIGMKEYYAANAIGLELSFVATLYRVDYDDEQEVLYDGARHEVIRKYVSRRSRDKVELYCRKKTEV